jgi:predicted molibdopterin-dependent oxidoreductase YjgC
MTSGESTPIESIRGAPVTVFVDGRPVTAFAGESVAAVLLALGTRGFRYTATRGEPRGMFCGIGVCYECLVTVDEEPNVRACVTEVAPGMAIETGPARSGRDGSR